MDQRRLEFGGESWQCALLGNCRKDNECFLDDATARLAQPAERKALNLVVVGSSPTVGDFCIRYCAPAFDTSIPITFQATLCMFGLGLLILGEACVLNTHAHTLTHIGRVAQWIRCWLP